MQELLASPSVIGGVIGALIAGIFAYAAKLVENRWPAWDKFSLQQASMITTLQSQVAELQTKMEAMQARIDELQESQQELAKKYWKAIAHIKDIHREYPQTRDELMAPLIIKPDL